MKGGIWHRVVKDKYLLFCSVATQIRSVSFCTLVASNTWKNLLKSVHLITQWLSWSLGSGNTVLIGRDHILSRGISYFLSQDLLYYLQEKNLTLLYQEKGPSCPRYLSIHWKDSGDLGLVGEMEKEWDSFRKALYGAGIQLQDRLDDLKWIGGDKSRILSFKNVYDALASKLW